MDADNIFSVSEINFHVKNVLENSLSRMYIEGEVANFTAHHSGHFYFSLKDELSSIRCVFFKSANKGLAFTPKTGDKVICTGNITVYVKNGSYQLQVANMYPAGKGLLQIKFEELKAKLAEEGLFEPEHKKEIPEFPRKIGLVTSPDGAAVKDVISVSERRFPVDLVVYPALMQGDKASETIVKGIEYFNSCDDIDLIIVTRGGGSQEDLFVFNDERIARAVYKSKIPLISAIGHEIDFTICDFVADLRAPTPSSAAEIAVPNKENVIADLMMKYSRILSLFRSKLDFSEKQLMRFKLRLADRHPKNVLRQNRQEMEKLSLRLLSSKNQVQDMRNSVSYENDKLRKYLNKFRIDLLNRQNQVMQKFRSLKSSSDKWLMNRSDDLRSRKEDLRELSPYNALKRGYAVLKKERKILKSVKQMEKGMAFQIVLNDGIAECECIDIVGKSEDRDNFM